MHHPPLGSTPAHPSRAWTKPGASFIEKVAILIDGGFYLKRLSAVRPQIDRRDPEQVAGSIEALVGAHLEDVNSLWRLAQPRGLLYRAFYYDATPFTGRLPLPISGDQRNYAQTDEAQFRLALFQRLRMTPSFAVRLGEVRRTRRNWTFKAKSQSELMTGKRGLDTPTDDDFEAGFQQKGVDMRIGVDIASITLKRQASKIVLVTGDADFVPAAKLARREGVQIILDPMGQSVSDDLREHIDAMRTGFAPPAEDAGPGA
ncbi:MAG: NYN domain-containing protein [Pseudomonadota bacterium]